MHIMVSKTHTMTLGKSKNNSIRIVGTSFAPKMKEIYLVFWYSEETCRDFI